MEQYIDNIKDYVLKNLDKVLKEPVGFIKHPFIDPGSVYDGNVWDWDTFWSVYGLFNLAEHMEEVDKERLIRHAKGNIFNFLDHQLADGYIPMMIELGKWSEPYLNMKRKEGVKLNMHKPFLCQQICLISEFIGDYKWISGFADQLQRYFECYDRDYYNSNCELYVWHDDIMIGMDNDPASFGRPNDSTANIYLNSFMVAELRAMAKIMSALSDELQAEIYRQKAIALIESIQNECWDVRDRFFYSVDVDIKTRKFDWFHQGLGVFWKTLPIKIRVWSGFIPMWSCFAKAEQVEELNKHIFDKSTFLSEFGLTTLAKDEKMFDLSETNNPSNWLGPIWLVANYVVFRGLLNYGYKAEAKKLYEATLRLLGEDLAETGSLHEYYDPFTGKPVMNGGFINWNILVLNMYSELDGKKALTDAYLL